VQRLHLVGFTSDLDGLIFSTRRGSGSGGYVVMLDDPLIASIREAMRLHTGEDADLSWDDDVGGRAGERRRPSRVDSALSPKEIQARLRAGRTVAEVAEEAAVDEEWVRRFASPVLAEQSQVLLRALGVLCRANRKGDSAEPLAQSVGINLVERGHLLTEDELAGGWSAYHVRDASWVVRFRYISRRRDQIAQWAFDLSDGSLVPLNRLGTELGYVEPGRRRRKTSLLAAGIDERRLVPDVRGLRPDGHEARVGSAPVVPGDLGEKVDLGPARSPDPGGRGRGANGTGAHRALDVLRPDDTPPEGGAVRQAGATRKAAGRKAGARNAPVRKAAPRKTTARKTTARKATTARKTTARKATTAPKTTARKATTAPKTTARKATTPRKATTARKTTTARKVTSVASTRRGDPEKAVRRQPTATRSRGVAASRGTSVRSRVTTAPIPAARKVRRPRKAGTSAAAPPGAARTGNTQTRAAATRKAAGPTPRRRPAAPTSDRASPRRARRPAVTSIATSSAPVARPARPGRRPRAAVTLAPGVPRPPRPRRAAASANGSAQLDSNPGSPRRQRPLVAAPRLSDSATPSLRSRLVRAPRPLVAPTPPPTGDPLADAPGAAGVQRLDPLPIGSRTVRPFRDPAAASADPGTEPGDAVGRVAPIRPLVIQAEQAGQAPPRP
jgi:hypothetical protein